MSTENLKLFFDKVREDDKLQEKLVKLSDENREELVNKMIEVGAERGYEFSRKDMKQFATEQMVESGELSEEEMEAVAGGTLLDECLREIDKGLRVGREDGRVE